MALTEMQIAPTIRLDEASRRRWDVIVIGAGPGGTMAAREVARSGASVLLVDRASFPRPKVCGCCVNGAAIRVLSDVGLSDLPRQLGAKELRAIRLASGGRFANVPLTEGVTLSRERLDAAMLQAAIEAGVQFLDHTQAIVGTETNHARQVILKSVDDERAALSRSIVVAGGLGCRVFAEAEAEDRRVSPSSRVGAGTVLDVAPPQYCAGTIYMACHKHGYVGLVRLEDDRLDVAAALDADAIKHFGGVAKLAAKILTDVKLLVPESFEGATWHGTGRLTQRRVRVAAERCFFIGDAAGYVEPFTGEGIAWALASGRAVAPIVLQGLDDERESTATREWTRQHRRLLAQRARLCRGVSRLLRYPAIVTIAVRLLALAPLLARPVVRSLNASFQTSSTISKQRR